MAVDTRPSLAEPPPPVRGTSCRVVVVLILALMVLGVQLWYAGTPPSDKEFLVVDDGLGDEPPETASPTPEPTTTTRPLLRNLDERENARLAKEEAEAASNLDDVADICWQWIIGKCELEFNRETNILGRCNERSQDRQVGKIDSDECFIPFLSREDILSSFAGKWIFLSGDSCTRSMVLALHNTMDPAHITEPFDVDRWFGVPVKDGIRLSYIDVIWVFDKEKNRHVRYFLGIDSTGHGMDTRTMDEYFGPDAEMSKEYFQNWNGLRRLHPEAFRYTYLFTTYSNVTLTRQDLSTSEHWRAFAGGHPSYFFAATGAWDAKIELEHDEYHMIPVDVAKPTRSLWNYHRSIAGDSTLLWAEPSYQQNTIGILKLQRAIFQHLSQEPVRVLDGWVNRWTRSGQMHMLHNMAGSHYDMVVNHIDVNEMLWKFLLINPLHKPQWGPEKLPQLTHRDLRVTLKMHTDFSRRLKRRIVYDEKCSQKICGAIDTPEQRACESELGWSPAWKHACRYRRSP